MCVGDLLGKGYGAPQDRTDTLGGKAQTGWMSLFPPHILVIVEGTVTGKQADGVRMPEGVRDLVPGLAGLRRPGRPGTDLVPPAVFCRLVGPRFGTTSGGAASRSTSPGRSSGLARSSRPGGRWTSLRGTTTRRRCRHLRYGSGREVSRICPASDRERLRNIGQG